MSDDEEGIEDLYEFWEQQEKQRDDLKKERNPNINQRLEDYLRSHSQQLSLHVQQYLNKIASGVDVPVNEKISNLGIMAFERSQFIKTLRKVQRAFEYQMQIVHYESKSKAKELALGAFEKMEGALQAEIQSLIAKYKELRGTVTGLMAYNEKLARIVKAQEEQLAQRDTFTFYRPYDQMRLMHDPSVFDKEAYLRPDHLVDEDAVEEANKQLSGVFSLFGGYMQISLNARDEVIENKFVKGLFKQIFKLKQELAQKDQELETLKQVVECTINEVPVPVKPPTPEEREPEVDEIQQKYIESL